MRKVYLIRAAQFYKIGISGDVNKRLKAIQTGCPIQCEYIGYFQTDEPEKLERELHAAFLSAKTYGEWFDLGDDHIRQMVADYGLKHSKNPFAKPTEQTKKATKSKALKAVRDIALDIDEIEVIYGSHYKNKVFTDGGKVTVRRLIIKYGKQIVADALTHLAGKYEGNDVWDKWKSVCMSISKYGKPVSDNVWYMYFEIKKKYGIPTAINAMDCLMLSDYWNNKQATDYIARQARYRFEAYDGNMWDCINDVIGEEV